jgi:hypothetical protein
MKKIAFLLLALFTLLTTVQQACAGQLRVHVAAFSVTGSQNKDEMRTIIQNLLASRLSSDTITVVESAVGADVVISGSYVMFGKIFSIDGAAKSSGGGIVSRAFVQGDSQDELIPAIGKFAKVLSEDLARIKITTPAAVPPTPEAKSTAVVARKESIKEAPSAEIVRPEEIKKSAGSSWVSQRLTGAMTSMAMGRTFANGEREIFMTGNQTLRYYRQGSELQLVSEIGYNVGEKILSVDTGDLDGDGVPEVYVTVISGNYLMSQVWVPGDKGLRKIAEKLPYFFRSIALAGGPRKIYAQEISIDDTYYGDVHELVKAGDKYSLKNPIKLPRFGNIYSFNMFNDAKGAPLFVVFNRDGYLIVSSLEGKELWRSSDKFSGSELYFQRSESAPRNNDYPSRLVFLDQRIIVTKDGEVIVPQNAGWTVIGNARYYSKYSVFGFTWNGSSLDEKWHTKQSQNYLADYAYDEGTKELLLAEVAQREGLFDKGATMVSIKKLD